jgi:hypothetical protein
MERSGYHDKMDFLQKLTEVARPNHTELLPTCFVSQDTLDSIRHTRWEGEPEDDTVCLIAVLKNGKELFLMKHVPSEVMFSLIENHPSAPGGDSRSYSGSSSVDEESASHGVYESDEETESQHDAVGQDGPSAPTAEETTPGAEETKSDPEDQA